MGATYSFDNPGGLAAKVALSATVFLALLAGTTIYLLDRDWASTLFLAPVFSWQPNLNLSLGFIGASLPSLCHAYAFTLLIILVLWPSRHARLAGALSWLFVACVLECLQAEAINNLVAGGTVWFADMPLAGYFLAYMLNGHFDIADLVATGLGVCGAFVASSILGRRS